MFFYLLLLFTIIPATELYLLLEVGSNIGAINTVAIIILTGIVGASLAKSQGLSVLNKIQQELSQKKVPTKNMLHALLVFVGGLLLLTPGFLTDILGFSMVIPGTRDLIAIGLKKIFANQKINGNFQFHHFQSRPQGPSYSDENVIEVDFQRK